MNRRGVSIIIFLFCYFNLFPQSFPSWRIKLVKNFKPDTYFSGCWGWYDPVKNREYAICTSKKGTWFVDVTNPSAAYIADSLIGIPITIWREVKTYRNYCYIISDDYMNTFQIVDLSSLPDSVRVVASPHKGLLRKGHTLWIDRHYLYVGSARDSTNTFRNMGVFNLLPNPENPQFLRWLSDDFPAIQHVHDMYVRNDTVFASAGNQGLYIYKYDSLQNKFIYLSELTNYLDGGYNHSSALTKNGKTLVFMDEVPQGLSIKITDVSNLSNIQILKYLKPYSYNGFTAHNPFVLGNKFLVASCYQDGTLVYDISNPANPVLTGYFDTYPQGGAHQGGVYTNGYNGNWGSYPFLPSGLIISNDMKNGIFILNADSAFVSAPVYDITEKNIKIFPQPCRDNFFITLPANQIKNIKIMNAEGKEILRPDFAESALGTLVRFSSHLPPGIYIATVTLTNQQRIHVKVNHE